MSVALVASGPHPEVRERHAGGSHALPGAAFEGWVVAWRKLMIRIMLAAVLLALGAAAHGQMYKWTDKDGKVHYSDMPPPQDAAPRQSRAPSPAKSPAVAGKGTSATRRDDPAKDGEAGGKFSPEEEGALFVLCGLAVSQFGCALEFKRYCTLDELVTGGPGGKLGRWEKDPRRDPGYQYAVRIQGGDVTFVADPLRPGLAGFLNSPEGGLVYNPGGRATAGGKKVRGGVNCQGFTK